MVTLDLGELWPVGQIRPTGISNQAQQTLLHGMCMCNFFFFFVLFVRPTSQILSLILASQLNSFPTPDLDHLLKISSI